METRNFFRKSTLRNFVSCKSIVLVDNLFCLTLLKFLLPPLFHFQHVSRNTYRGIVELLRFLIEGYEHSAKQKGIGGLASLFSMLEVMHTHYCGKRIQDGGVNPSKKTETKMKENGQKLRMTLSLDAKSDSSIVYTRGLCIPLFQALL